MKFKILLILYFGLCLSGCSALGGGTPTPLPTIVLESKDASPETLATGGNVIATASGEVVPAQKAQLASSLAGIVATVNVSVGDPVTAGQVLVNLAGNERLVADVESAKLELLDAQHALDQMYKDLPDDQTTALQALTSARDALRDAERRVHSLNTPAEDIDIQSAWASLVLARDKLEAARKDYEPYENKPQDNVVRAAYLNKLAEAQNAYEGTVRRYNNLSGVTGGEFDRAQAEAELQIAQARLEIAQQEYDKLQNGPDPDKVALAEERIRNAQARINASQTTLADLELSAPFNSTVGEIFIHTGEWVLPGQSVLVLVDLEHLRVETTDLSERDIPRIEVGGPVTVIIRALNQEVSGHVSGISPLASTLGGDVIYKTTIDLDTQPVGLRAGMSVEVRFQETK